MNLLLVTYSRNRFVLHSNKHLFGIKHISNKVVLDHIGKLDKYKTASNYKFGQSFINKVFAYRGIILHAWTAHSYNCNEVAPDSTQIHEDNKEGKKKCTPKLETYYQVLVDARDTTKLLNYFYEPVTWLRSNDNLVKITGIDYVSHKNIIPYISQEKFPVQHRFFNKFCKICDTHPLYQPSETYKEWQKRNYTYLEVNKVHKQTTNQIRVTVIPFFLGVHETSTTQKPEFHWRYLICLENFGNFSARLKETYLRTASKDTITTKRCSGLMGSSPVLNPSCPAFQISFQLLHLTMPSVRVDGKFSFEKEDGKQFDVKLPMIILDSKGRLPKNSN